MGPAPGPRSASAAPMQPLIAEALQLARAMKARIVIVADTAAQAEALATHIAITCGQHQRVPYKRAAAGAFGPLS